MLWFALVVVSGVFFGAIVGFFAAGLMVEAKRNNEKAVSDSNDLS